MADIVAQDCRLSGFRAGRSARWYEATHLPTGLTVKIIGGVPTKREAMEKLQAFVNEHENSLNIQELGQK